MIDIIPAMDIMNGKCVRLSQGVFDSKTVYEGDLVEIAKRFEDCGVKRLHMVDLDGAKNGRPMHLKQLQAVAAHTCLDIDYGGGIKSHEDVKAVFDAGATMISIGSIAVKHTYLVMHWLEKYGADAILIGVDVKNEKVMIDGWQLDAGVSMMDFLCQYAKAGITQAFCTDIAADGMLLGANASLYKKIKTALPYIRLIASGGVACIDDINELESAGCSGVIIGKALYEGNISFAELKNYCYAIN